MGKWINYKGQRFGRLLVVSDRIRKNTQTYYLCRCDCGTEKEIRIGHLKAGLIQSCGCLQKEKAAARLTKDITGQRFGFLVAVKPVGITSHRETIWLCKCLNCGGEKEVSIGNLSGGSTMSCGCISTSIGEKIIKEILEQLNVSFKQQYSFEDCLSTNRWKLFFDFAIFENEKLICLIEYQGVQHYEDRYFSQYEGLQERQERDNIKEGPCKQKRIPLIIIPYTAFKKINHNYIMERINERNN